MPDDTPMNDNEIADLVSELMESPAMKQICHLARDCPFDISAWPGRKDALVTMATDLIGRVDAGKLKFSDDETRMAFHAMLGIVFEVVLDGEFASGLEFGETRQ
jgi:hypothetical protein